MKKIFCLLLVLVMMLVATLSFVACNDNPEESSSESSSQEESSTESSSESTESESTETETGLREVENGNTELGPGWTVPIPPDYSKQ